MSAATETPDRPEGTKACPRCKGSGVYHRSVNGMGPTGFRSVSVADTCARCAGFGYCLNGDQLAAHCAEVARAALKGIEGEAAMHKENRSTRPGRLGDRQRARRDERIEGLRGQWRRTSNMAAALRSLVGTKPTLTKVREVAAHGWDSHRR